VAFVTRTRRNATFTRGRRRLIVMSMRRLLLIADDRHAVDAIRLALRQTAGLRVVATVDGRVSARGPLAELAPDVVVVDELRQRTQALRRLREASEEAPGASVVLLARGLDEATLDDVFAAGANAVIQRPLHPATLATLLGEVARGSVVHSPRRPASEPAARQAHLRAVAAQEAS